MPIKRPKLSLISDRPIPYQRPRHRQTRDCRANWWKTDPEKRKVAEEKMRGDWNKWMSEHAKMITDTGAGGKTKRVSSRGNF
jgi:hypothetical protein